MHHCVRAAFGFPFRREGYRVPMADHTRPSDITRDEEAREAEKAHEAGREPTPDEEAAAESQSVSSQTREGYEDMNERGAKQQGEGKPGV
jgi:hypothetical protein